MVSIKMAMKTTTVSKIAVDVRIVVVRIIVGIIVGIIVREVVWSIVVMIGIIRLAVVGRSYHATTARKNQNCSNK